LLFTLLLDDCASETPKHLWDLYHSFYLDSATFEMIQQQCKKLLEISETIPSWNEVYGKYFTMINLPTLKDLRRFWRKFSDSKTSSSEFIDEFKAAVKNVSETIHNEPASIDIAGSSGAKSLFLQKSSSKSYYEESVKRFWKNGTVDTSSASQLPFCNPLFFYSEGAGDRFRVDPSLCPTTAFHIVTSLSNLSSNSPFWQQREGRDPLDLAADAAKIQFACWTSAFRRFLRNPESQIRIRFFVGDGLSLCLAIRQLAISDEQGTIYVRPWSSRVLTLHDNCLIAADDPPLLFNVIDVGYLIDQVGLLNVLLRVVSILKPSPSVLYTGTRLQIQDEPDFLSRLLCGDVDIMCTFLGISPTDYIAGVSTQSYTQDNPSIRYMRIPWRLNTSGDPTANNEHCALKLNHQDLAKFVIDVHSKMFPHPSPEVISDISTFQPTLFPRYSYVTFAELINFIKCKRHDDEEHTQWDVFLDLFFYWINTTTAKDPQLKLSHMDILQKLLVCSVIEYEGPVRDPNRKASNYRHDHGVLKRADPPEIIAIVITVPRSKLKPIYDHVVANPGADLSIFFEVYLSTTSLDKFTSIQPIFGTLIPSEDGEVGIVEEDWEGWHGSSDLHLCMYMLTARCLVEPPKSISLSVRLSPDAATLKTFKPILGSNLEVFKVKFLNHQAVHLFSALPGLEDLTPPITESVTEVIADGDDNYVLHYPVFDMKQKEFTVVVEFSHEQEVEMMRQNKGLTVTQTSPCTALVTCSNRFQVVCTFPFPVSGVRHNLSLHNLSIMITATLLTASNRGTYSLNPFPIAHLPTGSTYNWNLPYINFHTLAKIDTSEEEVGWLNPHLISMFSDREIVLRGTAFDLLTNVKNAIHAMFFYPIVRLKPSYEDASITLFFTGHYHDFNSQSLVTEGYVWPVVGDDELFEGLEVADIIVNAEEMEFWRRLLPALVERCREFEHSKACEYSASGIPVSLDKGQSSICSCGTGKLVGDGFQNALEDTWTRYQPHVTRVAVSTIFAAAYVDATRTFSNAFVQGKHEKMAIFRYFGPIIKEAHVEANKFRCKVCWKKNAKKCSKCKEVAYCSKVCQNKDKKEHKKYCKVRETT
jgi:hypothetical protein